MHENDLDSLTPILILSLVSAMLFRATVTNLSNLRQTTVARICAIKLLESIPYDRKFSFQPYEYRAV